MFKTQVEPRVAGQRVVSLQSFEHLWRHFYGLYECRPWKIVVDLFFTITLACVAQEKMGTQGDERGERELSHPSHVSLARACSLFHPLLPRVCYAGYNNISF